MLLATKTAGTEHGRAFAVKVLDKEVREHGPGGPYACRKTNFGVPEASLVVLCDYATRSSLGATVPGY